MQLLLYSVFRIDKATNNMTWENYQDIAVRPDVEWIESISLGNSHRQFRVTGTSTALFQAYMHRQGRSRAEPEGVIMDPIVVAHGIASFTKRCLPTEVCNS